MSFEENVFPGTKWSGGSVAKLLNGKSWRFRHQDRSGKIAITNCNVRLQRMRLPPTEPGRCCFDLKALEAWWTSNETYQHPGATSSDPVVPKKADQKHLPLLPTPSSRKTDARASPSLRGPSPSLRGPSPSLRGPSPSLRGASPSLRGPSPSLRGPSPKTTGTHTSSTPPGPTPRKTDSKQPVSRPGPLSSKRTSDGSYRPGPLCSKTGRDASSSRPSKKSDEVDASENASSSKMTPKLTIKVSSPVTFVSSTKSEIGSPQDDDDARDDVSSPQPADANKSDSGVDEIDIESISSKESKTKKRPLESSSDDEVIKPSRTRTRRGNGDEDEDSPRSPERRRRSTRDLRERKIPNMADSSKVSGTGSAPGVSEVFRDSSSALSQWWTRCRSQAPLQTVTIEPPARPQSSQQPAEPAAEDGLATIKPDPDAMGSEEIKPDPDPVIPRDPRTRVKAEELKVLDLPVPGWWVFDPRRPRSANGELKHPMDVPLPIWYVLLRIRRSKRRKAWRALRRLRIRQKRTQLAVTATVPSIHFYENP